MNQPDFRDKLGGVCPHCERRFSLTNKGKVYGHRCRDTMLFSEMPVAGTVKSWQEHYDQRKADRIRRIMPVPEIFIDAETGRVVPVIDRLDDLTNEADPSDIPTVNVAILECLNCGSKDLSSSLRTLYCIEFCQRTAEAIRYHRRSLADGRINKDPLVKDAIQVNIEKLAQGVVVPRNRIADEVRQEVFARTSGICANESCDNPATELDHIEGRRSGDQPNNLQALCSSCHLAKSKTTAKGLSDEMLATRKKVVLRGLLDTFLQTYALRVLAKSPLLVCDDHDEWPKIYRNIMSTRRALINSLSA